MTGFHIGHYSAGALGALRIMSGLLFTAHGAQKVLFFPGGEGAGYGWTFAEPGAFAGFIELIAGMLIAVGLFTRPAAFIASGTMAVGYFLAHATQGFWPVNNGGDAAILYSFVFLLFAFVGGGPLSLDKLWGARAHD
jgi:putative oxidoreductase